MCTQPQAGTIPECTPTAAHIHTRAPHNHTPQVAMLAYLALVWPYSTWQLQYMELAAHGLETLLVILALVLLDGQARPGLTWAMVGECIF